jgi:putative hydrolase of the HAD superfamily
LEEYNTRINPRTAEVSSDVIIGRVLESWGLSASQHLSVATERFFAFFQRQAAIYDDSLTVLETLKRKGISTGILTDVPYGMKKEFVERDLNSVGILNHYIDVLLTSVDVGHRKPEPMGYVRLAHELGVEPCEMIYVGNERKDIEGANAAGVYSILIAREDEPDKWGQQKSVKSLHEIMQLI